MRTILLMHASKSIPVVGLLLGVPALLTFDPASLRAEDVIVTSCVADALGACPPSCPYELGTMGYYSSFSTAVPAGAARSKTVYGTATTAKWAITPTLASSPGVYRVYVSKAATYNCATDIVVKLVATSGCTLADTNHVAQAEVYTSAFQRDASLNVWIPVAVITNSSPQPTITFSLASGASSRWYMDEVRFENLEASPATPARISQILYSNPITLSGTGPVSHAFALLSSTNPAKPLSQWTREQTNTAGTGAFTFSVTPAAPSARFFRVITQ